MLFRSYSMNHGTTITGVVTGKPIHLGGSLGREKATGRGVFVTGREVARRSGIEIEGAKVALQGFGNVGSEAARLFAGVGARIVVIQDHTATLYNEGGIDMAALTAWQAENKQIAGFPGHILHPFEVAHGDAAGVTDNEIGRAHV